MVDVDVKIRQLNAEGLGESEINERPLLVRNALPNETVRARILKKRKGVRFADALSVLEEAYPMRVESNCPAFPRCGGCSLHHLAYPEHLALKEAQLRQALAEFGVASGVWRRPTSAVKLGYRTKARLGVRQVGDQVFVGFRESFSNRVAKLETCMTLTPELAGLITPLREMISRLSMPGKIPQIEMSQGDATITLILRHLYELSDSDYSVLREFERIHRLEVVLQAKGYDTLTTLTGATPSRLAYTLKRHGLDIKFEPHQFTQVNQGINQLMIDRAVGYIRPLVKPLLDRGRRLEVVDLFCGIGNFSLPIARTGANVVGLEASADAIDMAQENAQANGVAAEFAVADLYAQNMDPGHLAAISRADVIVLDPPRSGAGPALDQWLEAFPGNHVVYVSCNPKTFAVDATGLQNAGFALQEVGIFDMFPHTAHIETMGLFERLPS
ncbi:MAG: 23S rRNA (uracil(1939)-C(5))-methyltransferase RlmD [Pseudomonadota bacterium]